MSDGGRPPLNWPVPSEFPSLQPGELHIWAVPISDAPNHDGRLSPAEEERAAGFAFAKPRQTFVATRVALRMLLSRYLNVPPREIVIVSGLGGKPKLSHRNLQFNVAHSGDLALVAITCDCEVGVDLEQLRPVKQSLEIARRNFHPLELAAIGAAGEAEFDHAFLRCWTRKEAVVKALGAGIGYPFAAFDVLTASADPTTVEFPADELRAARRCWLLDLHPEIDYVAAVATFEPRAVLGFSFSL